MRNIEEEITEKLTLIDVMRGRWNFIDRESS